MLKFGVDVCPAEFVFDHLDPSSSLVRSEIEFTSYPHNHYLEGNLEGRCFMVTVTAAELQMQFGRFRDLALKEPVSVTDHEQDSLVLISSDEYNRLKALDTRLAVYPWELANDLAAALENSEPSAFAMQFDHEFG